MELYKVMIVDDEEEVREAIKCKLPWEELGFVVVDTAENGEEALEKAECIFPDVVLTDIQMPFMDGLTFCHKLREIMSNVKILIFSGYDEFEYAKEAIRVEAEEYLLKPVSREELRQSFLRLKTLLDEEMAERKNIDRLKQYYESSLPVLKEQFLVGVLDGRFKKMELYEYNKQYGETETDDTYQVLVFQTERREDTELDETFLPISIQRIAEEELKKYVKVQLVNYLGTIVVVVQLNDCNIELILRCAERICREASKVLRVNVTAGVGNVCYGLSEVKISYKEAKTALEYRLFGEENQTIFICDVEKKIDSNLYEDTPISNLIQKIKTGSKETVKEELASIVKQAGQSSNPVVKGRIVSMEIMLELIRLCKAYKLDEVNATKLEQDLLTNVQEENSLTQIYIHIEDVCIQLWEQIRADRKDNLFVLGQKAEEYILDNYSDSNCSVEKLCHYLGVSTAYFAMLFKKKTGMSFNNYLTKIRMEKAAELLISSREKAYIIAGEVGYEEPNYFSYAFKKYYGVSPIKYKTMHVEKGEM